MAGRHCGVYFRLGGAINHFTALPDHGGGKLLSLGVVELYSGWRHLTLIGLQILCCVQKRDVLSTK